MVRVTSNRLLTTALFVWSFGAATLAWRRERAREADARTVAVVPDWRSVATSPHVSGPATSPVTLVVFSDFECPFCRSFARVVDSLRLTLPQLRIVERHFPLTSIHPRAYAAAMAAECASAQGRYEPMRHALFRDSLLVRAGRWADVAQDIDIPDSAAFTTCMREERPAALVNADIRAAGDLGLSGTPSILINDSLFSPPPEADALILRLRERLRGR